MSNQAWQIDSPGHIVLNDTGAVPGPGPEQVLIRIRAASLNYRDILVIDHSPSYPGPAKHNLVPACDGAGEVLEAGPKSGWKKGDRVVVQPNTWMQGTDNRDFDIHAVMGGETRDGTLTQHLLIEGKYVFKAPDGLTFEEASTICTAGVTAWNALCYGEPKLGPGSTVLTQGTGGVSCCGIMVAAAAGATVIATSSSDGKLEVARSLGAKHLINYSKTPDWASEVLKMTDGKGVDIVLDVVGAESLEQSVKSTRYGGRISIMGILSKDPYKPVSIAADMMYGAKTIKGILGAGSKELSAELAAFMEKHSLHLPIARTFEFEEADKAIEALRTMNGVGKIVVKV